MAISQAMPSFRQKVPEGDVADYRIVLRQDDKGYRVIFVPKLAEDEKPAPGGETSLGRELNVWISTRDFSVVDVAYAE